MQKYFVKHKLSVEDITYLSDSDSRNIIEQGKLKIEEYIEIETYERRFLAQISDILPASVEVQIIEDLGERESEHIPDITIIQSLSNDTKFNYFIEKSVEIGIEKIIPVESKYSLKKKNKAIKDTGYWNKLVRDATEQSRNIFPTIIERPLYIKELVNYNFPNDSASTEYAFCNFIFIITYKNTNPPPASTWHPKKECARNSMGEIDLLWTIPDTMLTLSNLNIPGCRYRAQWKLVVDVRRLSKQSFKV